MIGRVVRWADADANIRTVVLNGSVVQGDHDPLSDLDVELYVRDPSELLVRRDWYDQFGELLFVEELSNPGWIPTRLLYLVDGKIDSPWATCVPSGCFRTRVRSGCSSTRTTELTYSFNSTRRRPQRPRLRRSSTSVSTGSGLQP